jgi:ABC-type sugar transport system permease subunit
MKQIIARNLQSLLRLLSLWGLFVALAAVGGAATFLVSSSATTLLRILLPVLLLLFSAAAIIMFIQLYGGHRRGRLWALGVHYIGFLGLFLPAIHQMGLFLVIDRIAANFADGFFTMIILVILVALRQWLMSSVRSRARADGIPTRRITAVSRISLAGVLLVALVLTVQIGVFPALWWVILRLGNLTTLGLLLGSAIMALVCLFLMDETVQAHFATTHQQAQAIAGFIFLTPNVLGFLIFFAGPLVLSFVMSFFAWDALSPDPPRFIGLGNYLEILSIRLAILASPTQALTAVMDGLRFAELTRFSLFGTWILIGARDPLFWVSLGNTVRFALMAVPMSVALALVLSSVLNSDIPGMKVFRVIFFIPSIAAIVGIALIWKWLYHGIVGFINFGLSRVTDFINFFLTQDLVYENINWLSTPSIALFAIAIMAVWQTVGFNTVLFLAGLQNIPKSLYEASTIDGAGPVSRFFRITLPLLAPTTFFVVATSTIQALQLFEQVYIATSNPETVNNATLTVVFYLYQNGFERFSQGYASATAWVLFLLIFVVTVIQYRRQKAAESLY